MVTLFLLFNHQFTAAQEADARVSLGVDRFIPLPADLQEIWSNIPPSLPGLKEYLTPIREWLRKEAQATQYVLIQGDFGACWLMVHFAFEQALIPVYSTTERQAVEELQPNGLIKLTHHFQHHIFRRYGV